MWGRGPAQGKNNFKKIYIYGFHQIVKDYTDNQWEKIKCSVCVNSINMSTRKASPHMYMNCRGEKLRHRGGMGRWPGCHKMAMNSSAEK